MTRLIVFFLPLILVTPTLGQDKKDAPPKRKVGFTIGKETTYVDGPLDKDGRIDCVAALNERISKGVTPENNANVLLWQAFGPRLDGEAVPAKFFAWMKMAAPAEKGDYFVAPMRFAEVRLKFGLAESYDFTEKVELASARPWQAKEYPHVAAWLKANEKPLATVVEATRRTHYYSPLVPAVVKEGPSKGFDGLINHVAGVQKCRPFADALRARAMLRVGEGRHDEAWQDVLACYRLARLVGRGGTLIEGLVGCALNATAGQTALGFLDGAKLDAKKIKVYLRDLQTLPPAPAMADKLDLGERFMFLDVVMALDREGKSALGEDVEIPNVGIHWDLALRNGNQMYDRIAAAMRVKDRPGRQKKIQEIEKEFEIRAARLKDVGAQVKAIIGSKNVENALGDIMGEYLIKIMAPAVQRIQDAADRNEQIQRNVETAFALAAYKADEGRYPKNLGALTPKYLASDPIDLFSGKAIVYRPSDDGFLLYSVGVNGIDDGGRDADADPRGDDLAVRLPLPRAKKD